MDSCNQIPILILHILEADISKNACIVEKDIDPTVVLNGGFDDFLAIFNTVVVGNSFTSCSLDLIDNYISGLGGISLGDDEEV